jgi:chromosome segregation ATPase
MDQKFQEVFSLKQSEIEADRNDLTQVRSELASALQKQQESEVNAMEWKCRCDQLTEKMQFLEEEHQKSHVELLTKHKTVLEQMKKFKQSYKNQEKQIKEIQEENEELKRNISVLQADSATNVEQLTIPAESSNVVPISSTIDVEKCQADLIETTNQLKCMTELLAATEEKYETAKVELGNVKAELVHHQNLIQSNDHYVQELKSCIVELQENIKTFEVETVQLIEKQAQLVAERNSFEGSLKYLNGLFQDQEAELTKLKESVALEKEQQTHQLDALIKKYDDKIQACETASSIELERLERMIREKEEEAEKLRSTIENISNSHPDVPADEPSVPQPSVDSAAIQMIQDESKSLRQQLDVLMNEKEALIQESKQLRASISELDYDMMELRQQQESQILQITTQHEAARGEFQETIDQIKGELESKNNMIEDDNRHIQSLQQEILEGSQRYQSKLLELEESIVQLTQEQGTLRDKVKVLEEQSEAKDRELLSKTEEIKRMMNLHEKEISRLQSAIEEAEAKLNSAYKERDRLQERVQTLETESTAEAQQLQDRQAELEESISQLTEEKEVFQEKVLFLQEQCQTKDRDLLLTMEDLENVTNNLMEVEKLKSEIEQDRLKIQQQLKDREEAFQRLEMQLQDSLDKQHTHKIQSEEIQEMKMTVEDLQREKEQWKGLVKEKTTVLEEYEQLNANLQRAINDFELQIFEQKQKMETFEEEKTTLSHKHQEDLWTLEEDLSLLRKELAIKDTTISKLRDEIALSTAKLNVTDQEQMKLIQDLASCQSALEEKIQRLEQLELDLSVSKIAHDQLTHQLGNQEKDNHNIRKSFEQFQQKYQLLEEQTQTLQMELSIKVEEINTLYSLNHDLQRQKELNIKQLQEQCNELNEMVSSLKDHDHEVTKERNHWQQKHQQVEQQMISMRNENQVLQEQISSMSELQQQYEELQENVKKMESKKKKDLEFLRKSNENISQLQHELNMWKQKYQDDVNQLNQQHDEDIKKLEEDMDSLTQTVCALTEERQGLQDQLAQSNTKSSSTPSEGSSFCMVNEVISPLTPSVTPLELHASDAESKVSIHVDATVEHQDNETNTGEYLESLLHEIISLKELIAQKEKEVKLFSTNLTFTSLNLYCIAICRL